MTLGFKLATTKLLPLWDFGWFEDTNFAVVGSSAERQSTPQVLAAFLSDPISQRSFCDQGTWGEKSGRLGPFRWDRLSPSWFRPVSGQELASRVQTILHNPEFDHPPSAEQIQPLDAWRARVCVHEHELFVLEAPEDATIQVEWAWIWLLFHVFVGVNADRTTLSVGVIGFD